MSTESKYIGTFFSAATAGLLALAAFNLYINPGQLFGSHDPSARTLEQVLAEIMASGYNVATAASFDERLLRQEQIRQNPPAQGSLVLGSSRVMEIRTLPENQKEALTNHWVGGADLADIMGLLQLHRERGCQFKSLLIGIDPWCFNGQGKPDPRAAVLSAPALRLEADSQGKKTGPDSARPASAPGEFSPARYLQLFTWGYTSQSILTLIQPSQSHEQRFGAVRYLATREDWNEERTYRADGSTGYGRKYRERSLPEIEAAAVQYATAPAYKLDNFTRLDPDKVKQLELLLDYLHARNIHTTLFLAPYHPSTYRLLLQQPCGPAITGTEKQIRSIAALRKITVLGSYDPQQISCGPDDFYDGMHLRAGGLEKALAQVREGITPPRPEKARTP